MNLSATSRVHPMIMGDRKSPIRDKTSIMVTMMMSLGFPARKFSTRRWMDESVFSCADDVLNPFVRDANLNETGVF